jgi:hypothetical protein
MFRVIGTESNRVGSSRIHVKCIYKYKYTYLHHYCVQQLLYNAEVSPLALRGTGGVSTDKSERLTRDEAKREREREGDQVRMRGWRAEGRTGA